MASIENNPMCAVFGEEVLPDENGKCSLCGGEMNLYGECIGNHDKAERLANNLKSLLEGYTNNIRDLVEEYMPDTGDTEEDSQKLCILNALSSFENIF